MGAVAKISDDIEIIHTPTFFEVEAHYSFHEKDKALELEWIETELAFAKQKLVEGASVLQKETISKLIDLVGKLTLKKEKLNEKPIEKFSNLSESVQENPAWHLHQKAQSGFETKV